MKMITFTTPNITVHVPGPNYLPKSIDDKDNLHGGNYDVVAIPPGEIVTLPHDEAMKIIDRFGGEIVENDAEVEV